MLSPIELLAHEIREDPVGAAGFEPTTSASQTQCSTWLSYAPNGRARYGGAGGGLWAPRYLRPMPPPLNGSPLPEQAAADRRTLVLIWAAVTVGVVLLTGVMSVLVSMGAGGVVNEGAVLFYANALISIAAIAGAFSVQRGLEARLPATGSYAEAAGLIRTRVLLSAAIMEASAFFAAVAAFLTGDLLNLAFVVPFFAFIVLFFPSAGRYMYWLALRERR